MNNKTELALWKFSVSNPKRVDENFWEVLRSFFKKLKIGVRYDAELELPKKRRSAAELARTENKPGFRLVHIG